MAMLDKNVLSDDPATVRALKSLGYEIERDCQLHTELIKHLSQEAAQIRIEHTYVGFAGEFFIAYAELMAYTSTCTRMKRVTVKVAQLGRYLFDLFAAAGDGDLERGRKKYFHTWPKFVSVYNELLNSMHTFEQWLAEHYNPHGGEDGI
jgi:hypothetical protein